MAHIEAAQGHDTRIIATTPEVAHDAHIPHTEITAIDPTDPIDPHTQVSHPINPGIKVDPTHVHPTNPPREIHTG